MSKILTPLKAIRAKCLECCAGQTREVRLCHMVWCSLYPYRMGKRPKTEETEQNADDRLEDAEICDEDLEI